MPVDLESLTDIQCEILDYGLTLAQLEYRAARIRIRTIDHERDITPRSLPRMIHIAAKLQTTLRQRIAATK